MKKMALIIGLNSGSSCDGVDCALARIEMMEDDQPGPPEFIDGISLDWPERLHRMIWDAFDNKLDLFALSKLNYAIGAFFGVCVKKLLEKTGYKPEDITCIAWTDSRYIFIRQTVKRQTRLRMSSMKMNFRICFWMTFMHMDSASGMAA